MSAPHDLLLEWASERGCGDWDELRAAWTWIQSSEQAHPADPAAKAWIAGASLAALGHLEMAWGGDAAWAVAPPVITMLPNSGGRALLTGARTRALYRPAAAGEEQTGAVADMAEALDVWIDDVPMKNGPTSVLIACRQPEDAQHLAEHCGIAFSYSVSDQLSAMLPPLAACLAIWPRGALPQGFPVERFDPGELIWREHPGDEPGAPGLYRARTYSEHKHVLVTPTHVHLTAAREHAVFEVLRWSSLSAIEFDDASQELWVPVHTPLPILQQRAAVLCSGRLPQFQRRQRDGLRYANVQPQVAERIAASLSQDLHVRA